VHYSDDDTDYPAVLQMWEPLELEKMEAGLQESDPSKWRGYVLGVWVRQQKKHKELRELYDTKLAMAEKMLAVFVKEHPDFHLPVTFDSWFTQPEFCLYLDKNLHLAYVGTLDDTDEVLLNYVKTKLGDFAQHLK